MVQVSLTIRADAESARSERFTAALNCLSHLSTSLSVESNLALPGDQLTHSARKFLLFLFIINHYLKIYNF